MRLQCRVPGKGCQLGLQVRIVPRLGLDQEKDASNICIRQPPQVRPGNSSTVAVSTTTAATTETSGQNMNTCQTDLLSENLQIGRRSLLKRHNIGTSVLFASFPPRDSQKIHPIWKAAEPFLAGTTCQCRRDMRWNTKAFECQV